MNMVTREHCRTQDATETGLHCQVLLPDLGYSSFLMLICFKLLVFWCPEKLKCCLSLGSGTTLRHKVVTMQLAYGHGLNQASSLTFLASQIQSTADQQTTCLLIVYVESWLPISWSNHSKETKVSTSYEQSQVSSKLELIRDCTCCACGSIPHCP